jgi:hypothetical protein
LAKTRYTPFLKLKVNEVGAIKELAEDVRQQITPFFDLPTASGMTPVSFCEMVQKSAKKLSKMFGEDTPFYLDNFDIPEAITVNGDPNYQFVISQFSSMAFIPVIGLNRTGAHNMVVVNGKDNGLIASDAVAVRLVQDEFEDFELVEDELRDLISTASEHFSEIALILDCRLCLNENPADLADALRRFIVQAAQTFELEEILVAGSSVPASIGEVAEVESDLELARIELQVFSRLKGARGVPRVGLGDYTVVSPLYSDNVLPKHILPNVMTPRVLYGHEFIHYVARGGALKTHARGNLQYNDILAYIVGLPIYRGPNYSYGDGFIAEKANMMGKLVTPSSILKPTINAHITYMVKDHPLIV